MRYLLEFYFVRPQKSKIENVFVAVAKLKELYREIKFQQKRWKNKCILGRTLPLFEQCWAEND